MLRQATQTIRNKEPINKVIWKVYYEKPYTDLIGRVIGNKVKTGIYKITNLENGMCYVGQAVHIADRWKQHIKRGIGAEPLTRNKLYPAMLSIGVENFSFEIIEECDRSQLNEREDYWQNFYKAKEFGYSIK
ncbi:MAG: GIY-YIG nuclease family protein [Bacilli bacterium]|nr:GIY-YIG nuclease family protein [Bacilli bacterium]